MSNENIFAVFDEQQSHGFGLGAANIPLLVRGYTNGPKGDVAMTGTRMDTGAPVTIRLAPLDNRDFDIADRQHDWPANSIVAVDGAYLDADIGEGHYRARWINRVAKQDQNGSIRFGMARYIYDSRDRFGKYKSKIQLIGRPRPVTTAKQAVESAVKAALASHQLNIGWPHVLITMRSADGSQHYEREWTVATAGQKGAKRVGDKQAQLSHFQSQSFDTFVKSLETLAETQGVIAAVHPAVKQGLGLKRAIEVDQFYATVPGNLDEKIAFLNNTKVVNEATRFPLDQMGQHMFAPCFLAFQRDQRTLVGIRQLSSFGPYCSAGDLPVMGNAQFDALHQADRYAQSGQNPPDDGDLRRPIELVTAGGSPEHQPTPTPPPQTVSTPGAPRNSTAPTPEPEPQAVPPQQANKPASVPQNTQSAQTSVMPASLDDLGDGIDHGAPSNVGAAPAATEQRQPAIPAAGPRPQMQQAQTVRQPESPTPPATESLPSDVDLLAADLPTQGGDDIERMLESAAGAFGNPNPDSEDHDDTPPAARGHGMTQ